MHLVGVKGAQGLPRLLSGKGIHLPGDSGSMSESGRSGKCITSVLHWEIHRTEEPGQFIVHGVARVGHDSLTKQH